MPRPILKSLPSPPPISSSSSYPRIFSSPHVHFPPTPALTSTLPALSPNSYDRAPIAVSPNSCALPERNGRLYNVPSPQTYAPARSSGLKGSYFHPRAFEACQPEQLEHGAIPDLSFSDSSDSSDESGVPSPTSGVRSPSGNRQEQDLQHALAFLPYGSPKPRAKGSSGVKKPSLKRATRRHCDSFREPDGLDGCLGGF